ncbi:MAG: bifunctional glycosyltransferase family 2/GtrA family protein [Oscillospiraceae bacterium]|nr:bifunctional glycosyltransferase family 2/GtrA family protein [Oscillospiraceae bacterium]
MNQFSGDCRNSLAIVLPSLDPDAKFSGVVSGLVESGFRNIVIVDDGSDADHQQWFSLAEEYPQCNVLHHGVNKGKGRALKTAFSYVLENIPDAEGVITIDGDGQHLLKDIIACGNRMLAEKDKVILGCRDFDLPGVPPRSVAGNKFTSRAFRLLFGIRISDTQTGLRAIPAQFLQEFCAIEGERFEYETNMLLQMKRSGIVFCEQPIETVYDPEDYSSHYNALKDSWKVGKIMLRFLLSGSGAKYAVSSVISFVCDKLIYLTLVALFGLASESVFHLIGTFSSSVLNFHLNKYWVFGKRGEYAKDLLAYYCVCIPRTLIATAFTSLVITRMQAVTPGGATVVNIIVDTVLFIVTYFIQKKWVFKPSGK